VRMTPKKLLAGACELALSVCMLLACGPTFAEHILVEREVLLEAAHPKAIARVPGGGYVIAGSSNYSAWATKVDESGKVTWRHEVSGSTANPCCRTEYRGIALLRDGTVLLCGVLDASPPLSGVSGRRSNDQLLGLLTRINARGEMTGKETMTGPQLTAEGERDRGLNYLDQCASVNDHAIVVGSGFRLSGASSGPRVTYFTWLLGLDSSGAVVSNKVMSIPVPPQNQPVSIRNLFALPRGDFMMIDPSHNAVRFKKDGEIESIGKIEIPILLSSGLEDPIRSIAQFGSSDIVTSGENLQVEDLKKGKDRQFTRTAAYRLPDGSLASFGSTDLYGGTAAVEWLSSDLAAEETKIFMPTHGAGQIDAVAPASRADEFATVRLLEPGLRHKVGPDETRSGILLAFLRFQ
jgi:hypothetical protein